MDFNDRLKYTGTFYASNMSRGFVKDWVLQKNTNIPDCLELLYCISGEEEVQVNDKKYSIMPGTVRISPPFNQVEEDIWIKTLKYGEFVNVGFITRNPFVTETVVINTADNCKIRDLFMRLLMIHKKTKGKSDSYFFEGSSVLFLLLQELKRCMGSENLILEELDKKLEPAMNFIYDHYFEKDFALHELPSMCGMKKNQFYNMFEKRHNITPSAYVTNLRMQCAFELLVEGKLSIGDIADKVGYESVAYFSRVFKKQYGAAPSKYKK